MIKATELNTTQSGHQQLQYITISRD